MKYKVIAEGIDGTKIDDIIEREPHAMDYHLRKGQVEVYEEPVVEESKKSVKKTLKKQKK